MAKNFTVSVVLGATLARGYDAVFKTAEQRVQGLQRNLERARTAAGLGATLAKHRAELQQLGAVQRSGSGDSATLAARVRQVGQAYRDAARQAREYGLGVGEAVRKQQAFAAEAKRSQAALGRNEIRQRNRDVRGDLQGQLLGTAAQGAAILVPVKIAADFESAMSKVGAVAGLDKSSAAFQALTATARDLGATTAWSASQSAEGMQYLAMAGFKSNQIIAAMPGMLDLASAGAIDLGSAADIASNILSGFGLPAEQMGRLGDVMVNTFTSSNTDLRMLGETMKYVAPVASGLGVSVEQAAAMVGKLGDIGIQGSQAGTSLRAVLTSLAAPSGEAGKALKRLGVATRDSQGNLRDMPTVLAEMNAALAGMGTADRAAIIKRVFGTEAMTAATELLSQAGSGALQEYARSLEQSGSAARVAREQNDNLKGDLVQLSSASEGLAISVGEMLRPAMRWTAQTMTTLATGVRTLVERFPGLSQALVLATAAAVGLKVAMLGARFGATYLSDALQLTKGGLAVGGQAMRGLAASVLAGGKGLLAFAGAPITTTLAGLKAVGAAMLANPLGLLIGALAVGALLVYKYWQPIKLFFSGLWDGLLVGWRKISAMFPEVGAAATQVKAAFRSLFQQEEGGASDKAAGLRVGLAIANQLVAVVPTVVAVGRSIWSVIEGIGQVIVWVGQGLGTIAYYTVEAFSTVGSVLSSVWNSVTAAASAAVSGVTTVIGEVQGAVQGVLAVVGGLASTVGANVQAAFGAVLGVIAQFNPVALLQQVFDQVRAYLATINLADAGRQIVQSIADGIRSAPGAIMDAIKAAAGGAWKFVSGIFGGGGAQGGKGGVPAHARGGIMTRPHLGLVAEAGPEAIIPLRDKARGLAVLQSAAQQLGATVVGGDGAGLPGLGQALSGGSLEGGAAVPPQLRSLLPQSGDAAGSAGGSGAGGIALTFAPQITVNGAADPGATAEAVQQALERELQTLQERLRLLVHEDRRLRYA